LEVAHVAHRTVLDVPRRALGADRPREAGRARGTAARRRAGRTVRPYSSAGHARRPTRVESGEARVAVTPRVTRVARSAGRARESHGTCRAGSRTRADVAVGAYVSLAGIANSSPDGVVICVADGAVAARIPDRAGGTGLPRIAEGAGSTDGGGGAGRTLGSHSSAGGAGEGADNGIVVF
jgi:hypothetical protein